MKQEPKNESRQTGIYKKNLLFVSGKNVSLVWKLYALNTFKLLSYYPSFDSEIPDGVYILSFDTKSLNFMTDGYVKKSNRERFFRGCREIA